MNTIAAWLALSAYLGFAVKPWRGMLSRLSARWGDWSVGVLLLPFLLATELQPYLGELLNMILYLLLPTLWLSMRSVQPVRSGLYNTLAVLSIWLPIEPDLFFTGIDLLTPGLNVDIASLSSRFELPNVQATLIGDFSLPIGMLTAILLSLYLFLIHRPLDEIGFNFKLSSADLGRAGLGLLAFFAVGLPIGMGIDFLRFGIEIPGIGESILMLVFGYLLVALPEEILFRGVIQNLLMKRHENIKIILPIAAVIFGLAHLNNATPRYDIPNWGYVLMASLAGAAYGWVYWRTKKVTASAITHALVNFVWGVFFAL